MIKPITKVWVYREKKEFSPNYFHKAVRWGCFLFSVYSILMIKYSLRRLRFLFSSRFSVCTSSTYVRVGIGCSLSAAKVVPGFHGQKRSLRQAV